jgi:hypothetical protein
MALPGYIPAKKFPAKKFRRWVGAAESYRAAVGQRLDGHQFPNGRLAPSFAGEEALPAFRNPL